MLSISSQSPPRTIRPVPASESLKSPELASGSRAASALKTKDIVVASDFDRTLAPWNHFDKTLHEIPYTRTMNKLVDLSPRSILAIATGRGMEGFRPWAHLFKSLPLRGLIFDNGNEMYVNQHGVPAQQWIESLERKALDSGWKKHLKEQACWDSAGVKALCVQTLKARGFQELPPTHSDRPPSAIVDDIVLQKKVPNWRKTFQSLCFGKPQPDMQIIFRAGESGIYLRRDKQHSDAYYQKAAKPYITDILKTLKQQGYPTHSERVPRHGWDFYSLEASMKDINKASALEHLLNHNLTPSEQQMLKGIITLGDNNNDVSMLSRDSFQVGSRALTNYPVISGDTLKDTPEVWNHPRARHVSLGDLAPGLEDQMEAIKREIA